MRKSAWLVVIVAGIVVLLLHHRLDQLVRANELVHRENVDIPTAAQVHFVSGGFDKLVADLYWLAFIQYCGTLAERGKTYSRSYDYVNLITALDPYFTKPYWFGCWTIGYWQKAPELADKILQRGMKFNPQVWDLAYLAGVNQYLFAHDYKLAAHYYKVAATEPGAPEFLARQAKVLESPLPEMIKRFQLLKGMFYTSKDSNLKTSVYSELVSSLDQMYRVAPTEIARTSIKDQLEQLKKDYEKDEQ